MGAAVTQANLIDHLLEAASEAAKRTNGNREVEQCGPDRVYTALAHHLQRIAGNPVRPHLHSALDAFVCPRLAIS